MTLVNRRRRPDRRRSNVSLVCGGCVRGRRGSDRVLGGLSSNGSSRFDGARILGPINWSALLVGIGQLIVIRVEWFVGSPACTVCNYYGLRFWAVVDFMRRTLAELLSWTSVVVVVNGILGVVVVLNRFLSVVVVLNGFLSVGVVVNGFLGVGSEVSPRLVHFLNSNLSRLGSYSSIYWNVVNLSRLGVLNVLLDDRGGSWR